MKNSNLTKTILVALAMMTATPGLLAWKSATKYATGTLTTLGSARLAHAFYTKKAMSTNEIVLNAFLVAFGGGVTAYLHKSAATKATGTDAKNDNKQGKKEPELATQPDEAKAKAAKAAADEAQRAAEEAKKNAKPILSDADFKRLKQAYDDGNETSLRTLLEQFKDMTVQPKHTDEMFLIKAALDPIDPE